MTYFFHIGFDGGRYKGWQFQPNLRTVQGAIEDTLQQIFKKEIRVEGCGRTDAGVHASQYVLHIQLEEDFDFDLKFRLNKNLPDDIVVYDILEMKNKQHARFDAISRTYDYFIHLKKDPFLKKYSSFYEFKNLDFEAMKKAAELFMKYDDFKSICKQPDLYNHTRCNVTHAKLYVDEKQERLRFTITANRFLRGMIRLCVYFLLEVGRGRMTLEEFEDRFGNRKDGFKRSAYPDGLFLSKVEYPYLKMENESELFHFLKTGLEN
jgi:tRNA pseudouridine38-40 synthase